MFWFASLCMGGETRNRGIEGEQGIHGIRLTGFSIAHSLSLKVRAMSSLLFTLYLAPVFHRL